MRHLVTLTNDPASELLSALNDANDRAEKAFESWDEEAYEAACESAHNLYKQLTQYRLGLKRLQK